MEVAAAGNTHRGEPICLAASPINGSSAIKRGGKIKGCIMDKLFDKAQCDAIATIVVDNTKQFQRSRLASLFTSSMTYPAREQFTPDHAGISRMLEYAVKGSWFKRVEMKKQPGVINHNLSGMVRFEVPQHFNAPYIFNRFGINCGDFHAGHLLDCKDFDVTASDDGRKSRSANKGAKKAAGKDSQIAL